MVNEESINISEFIDSLRFKRFSDFVNDNIDNDSTYLDLLSFASPEDISLMIDFFHLSKEDILEDNNLNLMKLTYNMAKLYNRNLFEYMYELSNKLGGRQINNFNRNALMYQQLLVTENEMTRNPEIPRYRVELVTKEREGYEKKEMKITNQVDNDTVEQIQNENHD